jgi:hypothetical protein
MKFGDLCDRHDVVMDARTAYRTGKGYAICRECARSRSQVARTPVTEESPYSYGPDTAALSVHRAGAWRGVVIHRGAEVWLGPFADTDTAFRAAQQHALELDGLDAAEQLVPAGLEDEEDDGDDD